MLKNYIGIIRDHSGSMSGLARAAKDDYNITVEALKKNAIEHKQDTILSVIKCAHRTPSGSTINEYEVLNSSVYAVSSLETYEAKGANTPLFDAVGTLIEQFKLLPDAKDPNVSFLIMVFTDGEDNASYKYDGRSIGALVSELQNTDRWTFAFRVPVGYKSSLVKRGISEHNVLEVGNSIKDLERSTATTSGGLETFYKGRTLGVNSTKSFYQTDLSNVTSKDVQKNLTDISGEVTIWPVLPQENEMQIRDFVEKRLNDVMLKGSAFYQLNKYEKKVQDYKEIVIVEKSTGYIYAGRQARDLLGIPHDRDISMSPGNHGKFEVYIQSTSVNRKVLTGTKVLYWPKIGVPFTEGKSKK